MTAGEEKKLLRDLHSIAESLKAIAKVASGYQIIDISCEEEGGDEKDEDDEWV